MYQSVTRMITPQLYEAVASNQKVLMSAGNPDRQGQTPMELILSAVAGCSAIDVVEIITKRRHTVAGLEIQTTGERRDEYPRIFTKINLHYVLTSPDADENELKKAVALSVEKYCSVAGMLNQAAEITWSCAVTRP